jgi:hypothetical protein
MFRPFGFIPNMIAIKPKGLNMIVNIV